jgi:cobyric acid synthase
MIYVLLLLGMCGLVGCTSEPPVVETPVIKEKVEPKTEKYAFAILVIICNSLDSILDVMEEDKISKEAATASVKKYAKMGLCGVVIPPQPGMLGKLVASYVDYDGTPSQIWKLKGIDLWTIVAVEYIEFKSNKKPKETQSIGHTI